MSNLKTLLKQRRSKFYEGDTLQKHCDDFMQMVSDGADVHDFGDTIIVLENYGLPGNVRAWLLFNDFTRSTVRAMQSVVDNFTKKAIYASTHDKRIKTLLEKMGFTQYSQDENDFYLVFRRKNHGM